MQKEDFPQGFFVIVVVHADDYRCSKNKTAILPRNKRVSVIIESAISEDVYIKAIIIVMVILAAFIFLFYLLYRDRFRNCNRQEIPGVVMDNAQGQAFDKPTDNEV